MIFSPLIMSIHTKPKPEGVLALNLRPVLFYATLLSFALLTSAFAADLSAIGKDFKPLSGIIIMPVQDEYLIDVDAGKGVAVGDLFSVVKPGEKVIHPVTREVLGSLDEVKGILQVTRIKTGYSYARPVREAAGIKPGDAVRRFENVAAAFWDQQGTGEELFKELKATLPQLEWQGYYRGEGQTLPADTPPLVFALRSGKLEVLGPGGRALFVYPVATSQPETARPAAPIVSAPTKIVPAPTAGAIAVTPAASAIVPAPEPATGSAIVKSQSASAEGLWMSPEIKGELVGLAVADINGDGRLETALAFSHRLEIGRISGGRYEVVTSLDLGFGQKVVSIDSADLDRNGVAELYLTAADKDVLKSLVVTMKNGKLAITNKNLPWYFRTVRLPGEEELLLAQSMGRLDRDFDGHFLRLEKKGDKLIAEEPVVVPDGLELFGFGSFTTANGEQLFAQINFLDNLKVVKPSGETIWSSEERFGGGEAFIERKDPDRNPAEGPTSRNAYMQKRLELGANGELLVPVNEGSRLLRGSRNFDRSHIKGMVWSGFSLQEQWRTQPQEAYLADYRLADADNDGKLELVQALVFSRDGFGSKARSALAIFELP